MMGRRWRLKSRLCGPGAEKSAYADWVLAGRGGVFD